MPHAVMHGSPPGPSTRALKPTPRPLSPASARIDNRLIIISRQLFDVIGTGESASVRETYGETSNGYYDNREMSYRCRCPRDFGPEPGELPTSSEIEGITAAANDAPLLSQRLGVVLSQFSVYDACINLPKAGL